VTEHKHTNALINETSPYLLQHAHNPVDWHPWGEAALAKARTENKPILLSIGYSACHWCHVMEHESFENEDIARLMNDNFINIKVDREERPDLDQIYMTAVQMMTGQGGWPMTMFLTPEGVPFYGGTYFPPVDRYNMPGFPRILLSVAEAYRSQPDQVANTVTNMLGELRRIGIAEESRELLTPEILDSSYRRIAKNYDRLHGGFGGAPKFPPAMTLEFLLHTHYRTRSAESLDHIGGGFHRYSVDAKWLVPHFEKMLYDNALLSRLYLHVCQVTRDSFARRIAEETLDYVAREMTDSRGGFYSSQDADSEGEEGKFFVWTRDEVLAIVGKKDAAIFSAYYDVTSDGNFEGKNILHVNQAIENVAQTHGLTEDDAREVIERARQKLFEVREQRVKPGRDEKVLTAWNGLMLASFAEASAILDRDDYRQIARANASFLLREMQSDGLLRRTWKDGEAKLNAYLEDYASLVEGLIALYEATGELDWIENAIALADKMIDQFWDEEAGGFFFTGRDHEQLIVRSKEWMDNATPSGNSIAAVALLKLSALTANEDYQRRAVAVFRLIADQIRRYPSAFGYALQGLDFYLSSPVEVVIAGKDDLPFRALEAVLHQTYLPNRVIAVCKGQYDRAAALALLRDRTSVEKATAYVCRSHTCESPVSAADAFQKQLESLRP
jgi:uncharacterized protein